MEQMDIVYSKGTEEIAQSMMSQIPAHHAAETLPPSCPARAARSSQSATVM